MLNADGSIKDVIPLDGEPEIMTGGFLLTTWLLAATLSGISLLAIPAPPIPVKNLTGGYSAVRLTDDVRFRAPIIFPS